MCPYIYECEWVFGYPSKSLINSVAGQGISERRDRRLCSKM